MIIDGYLHLNSHKGLDSQLLQLKSLREPIAERIAADPKGLANDSLITNVSHECDLLQRSQIR